MRPNLSLNLGLRYDIMKPYTELYDRWSYLDATMPNPASAVIRARWCSRVTGRTAATAARRSRPTTGPSGRASVWRTALNHATVLRAAYGINYSRRGAVGGRAGARNGTGMLGFSANASFPSPNAASTPRTTGITACPSYPAPPFFDPSLNTGFVTGRGTGGSVTYGDPEIGGRRRDIRTGMPASSTRSPDDHRRRVLRRKPRRLSGGSGRGFFANQLDPKYLPLGNLLTQQATRRQYHGRAGDRSRRGAALCEFLGHHRADAAAVPAVLGRDRRLRQRRALGLPLAAADRREAPVRRWADR